MEQAETLPKSCSINTTELPLLNSTNGLQGRVSVLKPPFYTQLKKPILVITLTLSEGTREYSFILKLISVNYRIMKSSKISFL